MIEDYLKNYRVLGIQPGANWEQLRQAYKKLVNAWHPDRFQQNSRQKKMAEEKTKEITQSYQELAEYYKRFGVLPLLHESEALPTIENDEKLSTPVMKSTSETMEVAKSASIVPSAESTKHRMPKRRDSVIASVVLLGLVYLIWQDFPDEEHQANTHSNEEYGRQLMNEDHENKFIDAASPKKRFTVGSSLGEVYTIQGVPTKVEKDIWYYGNSKVYFSQGKVLDWEVDIDNPLQAETTPGVKKTNDRSFSKGSSKEEVMAAQGPPNRDSGNVWDYGVSRVYFENNRVTGWRESPFNPLRTR